MLRRVWRRSNICKHCRTHSSHSTLLRSPKPRSHSANDSKSTWTSDSSTWTNCWVKSYKGVPLCRKSSIKALNRKSPSSSGYLSSHLLLYSSLKLPRRLQLRNTKLQRSQIGFTKSTNAGCRRGQRCKFRKKPSLSQRSYHQSRKHKL